MGWGLGALGGQHCNGMGIGEHQGTALQWDGDQGAPPQGDGDNGDPVQLQDGDRGGTARLWDGDRGSHL